jgi:hypothetical protein
MLSVECCNTLECLEDVISNQIYCFKHYRKDVKTEKKQTKTKKYKCRAREHKQYARSCMYSGDRDPNHFCIFDTESRDLPRIFRGKKRLGLGLPISRKLQEKIKCIEMHRNG